MKPLVFNFSSNLVFWCFLFYFSCCFQDFKFWYVNRKAFGASFLFWVDFKNAHCHRSSFNPFIWGWLLLRPEFQFNCEFFEYSAVICFNIILADFVRNSILRLENISSNPVGVRQEFQLKQITSAIVILDSWHRIGIFLPKLFWPTVRKKILMIQKNFWNSRLKAEN